MPQSSRRRLQRQTGAVAAGIFKAECDCECAGLADPVEPVEPHVIRDACMAWTAAVNKGRVCLSTKSVSSISRIGHVACASGFIRGRLGQARVSLSAPAPDESHRGRQDIPW